MSSDKLDIYFLHPDLGLGGAERLIVDAAVGQQKKGHRVEVWTSRHDPERSFAETHDGTLKVKVAGDFIPRHFMGMFMIVFVALRSIALTFSLLFHLSTQKTEKPRRRTYVCDQSPYPIPILRLFDRQSKILFYCHFPDKLLSPHDSILKKIYRYPFDWLEEVCIKQADSIVVNSQFTRSIFQDSFQKISMIPDILYPPINLSEYDKQVPLPENHLFNCYQKNPRKIILSINRFERKKRIDMAVEAYALLRDNLKVGKFKQKKTQLIIAGGYDKGVNENVEHHLELDNLAKKNGFTTITLWRDQKITQDELLKSDVVFLPSFTEAERYFLLKNSLCLLYTPPFEHFGIVPCEAMYSCLPVIAVNNGGPKESIAHKETGFLVESNSLDFSKALIEIVEERVDCQEMGKKGRQRVKDRFSLESFSNNLQKILVDMFYPKKRTPKNK